MKRAFALPSGQIKRFTFKARSWANIAILFLLTGFFVSTEVYSQAGTTTRTVTGSVTDDKGQPVSGATVTVPGTSTSTITGSTGNYSIGIPAGKNQLTISHVNYESVTIAIGQSGIVDVLLKEKVGDLNAVVVTGYTAQRKKDIIGAVAVVNSTDLKATPAGNVTIQLQGRAAGVTVGSDGAPGSIAKVRIRGFGSFGGSDPLYIIDGVPSVSGINYLNPSDIESLQVLKDAASASVYGSRAANGVVIITTKKGKQGNTKVSFDAYYGSNYVGKNTFPDLLNAQEYGELYWKAMQGAGLKPGDPGWTHPQYGNGATPVIPEYIYVNNNGTRYGGAQLETLKSSNPTLFASLTNPANYNLATNQIVKAGNTDWFDEIFSPASQQNYQLNVSGGSDKAIYSLSLNYFNQNSPATKHSYFDRYTSRVNSQFKITKGIRVGENISLSYIKSNLFSVPLNNGTNVTSAYMLPALIPVYDIMGGPAGSAAPNLGGSIIDGAGTNPVTEPWRNRFDRTNTYAILGNTYLDIDILKNLTFHSSFGIDYVNNSRRDFNAVTYEHAQNTNVNQLSNIANYNNTWTWSNTLSYNETFARNHSVKVLLGTEAIKTYAENLTASRLNYSIENDPNFLVLNAGTGTQSNTGNFDRNSLFSLFGRIDYDYAEKYLVSATLRRDESSKFAASTRTGYFPAVAAGWRISSEKFMEQVNWVRELKLRASWGIIGNQNGLSNENQYNIYVQDLRQGYPINGSNSSAANSFTLSRIGNSNAKWEENTTTNIGLDLATFNGFDLSVELYKKETKGLLAPSQLPLTGVSLAAANVPYINSGNIVNKGIDVNITKSGMVFNKLRYESSITFTRYKNEVTKVLDNPAATIASGNTRIGNVNLTRVGYPIAFFYGYKIDGFFNTQAEVAEYNTKVTSTWIPPAVGRWRIKDIDGNGVINASDRTFIGSPHPKFQMGWNLNLQYRNFDFTSFLFWNYGSQIFNQARWFTDFNNVQFNRSSRMLYESWTPELGNNAKLPKLDLNDTYSNANVTDYFVESGSYLRLKTVQLGYTLPASMVKRLSMDRLRLYVQAQNLFTITDFTGFDPDANFYGGGTNESTNSDISMGISFGSIPTPQQVLVGVSIGF